VVKRFTLQGDRPGQALAENTRGVVIAASACQVETHAEAGAAVIHLRGELDVTTATEVGDLLQIAVGEPTVVLDLGAVHRIDSAGLTILQEFVRRVATNGGWVAVARPSRLARQLEHLVGTEGFVFLAFSAAGALAWMSEHHRLALVSALPGAVILPLDPECRR
jgi:anti-anti-sigma factor